MPGPHPQGADLLGFLEQALRKADQPEPAPILDPEGNKYHAHWERGVPLYHKTSVTVHAHPDLGVDGRLGAYECVGPGWQLNVLLTHVRFGEETKDFLDTLSLAYRRLSLLAPTIIIGDLNAAPTDDDRTGPPTATDTAVWDAMHQLGLTDLTAGLTGTPSHYPHQAGTHPSRIDTCYGDPTTVRVHEAAYGDLPPTGTGHRPLYIDLIIPNLPPPAATLPDDTLPPTLQFPAEDDHGAWHRYNRALHAILRRPGAPTLTTAMRRAAQACGIERDANHTGAPPDLTLQQLVHDIWTTKGELATLLRPSTPEARDRDTHLCALLTTRRHQLQEWHAHRIAAAAQERERYGRNDTPYKSLRYVSRILEDTGRRTIHAVRTPEGGLTNDPDAVLQAVLDSFQAQHGDALPELDPHTRNTIREHVPRVFNREQRRVIEHDPFSISELQRALDRLKTAEAYQRLTLPIKRRLAARLWDIVTGATPIPPEWASLVHPLYKKGGLGAAGELAAHSLRHHRGQAGVDAHPRPHRASGLRPHARQHVGGHGRQVPPRGHLPPGHRTGHEPLRDDHRLQRCPRRVPPRPTPPPHGGMGCHGPPIPIFHDRLHRDPTLSRHHSRGPHPLDRHRQRGPPGRRRRPLPLPPRHPATGIRASTGIPRVRPIPATVPPHQLRR